MNITPVDHGLELGASKNPRSGGLHLSEIYNDLFARLEPKRYSTGGPINKVLLEAGVVFEELLERALVLRLQETIGRPEEIVFEDEEEGIIIKCSPDLFIIDEQGNFRIGEIKLTWKSSRDVPREAGENGFPPKFKKYFVQMMGYCYVAQTPYARLITLFVNGQYIPGPPEPELLAWDIEFSTQELQENWAMLLNHARDRGLL